MIIEFIKSLFKGRIKFYDNEGKEVKYIKYYSEKGMILIERNGRELIPINGLTISNK